MSQGTEREEKKMRIGSVNVNHENLNDQELSRLEHEIHEIRKRRREAKLLRLKMTNLINEAQEAGFNYKDYGIVLLPDDIEVCDLQ